MSGLTHVPPKQRAQVQELVLRNPGRRAAELNDLCEGALLRAWIAPALAELLHSRIVQRDEGGRYSVNG